MEFKTASVISTGLHAAVLLWAVVSFTGETFKVTPAESLPVDLVSEKEFSQLTKGIKEAPKPIEQAKADGREKGRAQADQGHRQGSQDYREEGNQGGPGKAARAAS